MGTFRPKEHVRRRVDFEQAYATGAKVTGRLMTLFVRPNGEPHARLGIAATRKIGGAVVRNHAKRVTRELFRHRKPPSGLDVIVVPRREFPDAPYAALEREFGALLERAARTPVRPAAPRPRRAHRPRGNPRV